VTEVDTKEVDERGKHVTSKDRILKQCKVRVDDWADVVVMRVTGAPSDLHTSDAIYHKDCLSQRSVPGDSKEGNKDTDETPQSVGVRQLITEMRAECSKIWDSMGLQELFTELVGSCMKKSD